MWIAALVACSGPTSEPTELSVPFAMRWGAANRSEGAVLVPRPDEAGLYVGLELAVPARTDNVIVAMGFDGAAEWQVQWGNESGDDQLDTLVTLSDGTIAAGGRRVLNPSTDSDSIAVVSLIDPSVPEVVDPLWWMWNASSDDDRVAAIRETSDRTLALAGQADGQVLLAEILPDPKQEERPSTVVQDRFGDEVRAVSHALATGDRAFVVWGQQADPLDFNDFGQAWVSAATVDQGLADEQTFGELYKVEDQATDVLVLPDGSWIVAVERGDGNAAFVEVDPGAGTVGFEALWTEGGFSRDPKLAQAPDGTVFVATVGSRDELSLATLDPLTGAFDALPSVFGVDRIRDLWVDDTRLCAALALPGDVDGAYLASVACAARTMDDGLTWPSLR